jgi:signal transduction histidine kinase
MNTVEQTFHNEIEIERIRTSTEQGTLMFSATLPFSIVVVVVLWDKVSHSSLLFWVIALTAINLVRWIHLEFYKTRINVINRASVQRIKLSLLIGTMITGSCWGMANLLFIDPAQPYTLLIMSVASYFVSTGAIVMWFNYLPAVLALIIPVAGSLIIPLLLLGDKDSIGFALALAVSAACGFISSIKIGRIYNSALQLNFENVALRQESDKARKAAENANTAKTRFLAAASHDLRQPIHALGLFFAELSDRVRGPETSTLIAQVDDSITAINSMLNALLDVSKLDAGVVKPNVESFTLTALFARLESEFKPVALENHNELRIRCTSASVRSDPAMLERILRNLISNALRYTQNGRVLVAARPRDKNVEIQVFDNGPGIPKDQLDEIFIEFHQLDNPARDRRQGLGLGLAIVKRLANLLKHEIKVVSNFGRGCCFSITSPRVQGMQGTPNAKLIDVSTTHALAECPVLVLDDDIAILEGMRGLLTRWGCQVITALSPAEAFDKLNSKQIKPKLLIVDYRLPDNVSGIEVAKNLQNRLAYPVSVLIITGDTGPERLQEADSSSFPLLHKPVQPAKLRSTLQYLLSKQNTR